jgi:uncharacterized membrane protein HdeD (DUF308 family)
MNISNRQWRVAYGAIAALCSFLLLQPQVQELVPLAIVIGAVNVVVAYIKSPPDIEDPAA